MDERLASLRGRRDMFLATAKGLLMLCTLLWLASMCFYDTAADPGADRPKILLPTRLGYALIVGHIEHLDIRRIWGGPATLFGLTSFAASLTLIAAIAMVRAWMNRRALSRLGPALGIIAIPLWALSLQAGALVAFPTFVRPEAFQRLADLVDRQQPGTLARLHAGQRLALPANVGAMRSFRVSEAEGRLLVNGRDDARPLRDQADAEAMRFALAQQAMFANDRATLRRLLPIHLAMPATDLPARNDIAQRLAAMGRAAGAAPVPPADAAWVEQGEARWLLGLRLIRINRFAIQTSLALGLAALFLGLLLRRRMARIEGHSLGLAGNPVRARSA
jgi:hypothetical protein